MKKVYPFFFFLLIPIIAGCDQGSGLTQLTYGTYEASEAIQLSSSEFSTHFENEENFLLTIYPKDSHCFCWSTFSTVIDEVVKNEHLMIYKYYAQDVSNNAIMQEVGGFYDNLDAPSFYIINNKKIAKTYRYSNNTSFFKSVDGFLGELNNHIKKPKMYYLNEAQLDEKLANKESFSVFFARNECGDCNYVIPHTLVPYFDALTVEKKDLYIFDLQSYRDLDPTIYQETKDKYLLSEKNNARFGFGEGVVPTFQYYSHGELNDMCVYFNEGELTYSEADKCYYATGSYYNETRLPEFHYLDNVEIKDLTKVQIKGEDTTEYKNSHYWNQESSSNYYDPILKAFLDKYL